MPSKTQALFYDRSAGEAEVVTFDRDGHILHTRRHAGWQKTWDEIVVGRFLRNQPHLRHALFYDRTSGAAVLKTFDYAGHFAQGAPMRLRRTWDVIVADSLIDANTSGGQCQTFVYDRNAGEAAILGFQSAHDVDCGHTGLRKSWDIVVSGRFAPAFTGRHAKKQICLYDRAAGIADLLAFQADGAVQLARESHGLRSSWDRIESGPFLGEDHDQILLYDRHDGAMSVVDFAADGTPLRHFPVVAGLKECDALVTGRFFEPDRALALLYDRSSGSSLFARFDHAGAFHTRAVHTDWRTSWDIVVTLPGEERDQVLLYDRSLGDISVLTFDAHGNSTEVTNLSMRHTWSKIVPLGPAVA
jgi:hypothetical protein